MLYYICLFYTIAIPLSKSDTFTDKPNSRLLQENAKGKHIFNIHINVKTGVGHKIAWFHREASAIKLLPKNNIVSKRQHVAHAHVVDYSRFLTYKDCICKQIPPSQH